MCRNTNNISAIHNMLPGVKTGKHEHNDNGKTTDTPFNLHSMYIRDDSSDSELYYLILGHPENSRSHDNVF